MSSNPPFNLSSSRKESNSMLSDTAVSSPSSTNLEDFPLDKVRIYYVTSQICTQFANFQG